MKNKLLQLDGSALFYALLVSVLIATFSTAIITVAYYHQTMNNYEILEQQLIQNAYSGIELLKAIPGALDKESIDLYGEQKDSVALEKKQWGLFEVGTVEAYQHTLKGKMSHQKALLLGQGIIDSIAQSAIYLKDGFKPLVLAGKTTVNGAAYLPKSGVKGGQVNGIAFSSDTLINGTLKKSRNELRGLSKKYLAQLDSLKVLRPNQPYELLADSTHHSFFKPTLVVKEPVVYIHEQELSGNICVLADSLIYISRHTIVQDIILCAPDIYIEEGFVGNLQAFASRTLEVGTQSQLNYPSVLALLPSNHKKEEHYLKVYEGGKIKGLILVHQTPKGAIPPLIQIGEKTFIEGQIYCHSPKLSFNGTVWGNITTEGFWLQTGMSSYDNHLLGVTIDYTKRENTYVSPFLSETRKSIQIAKYLY